MPQNRLRRGGILLTPYGVATFLSYREKDNVYRLKLPYAELYVKGEFINPSDEEPQEDIQSSENMNELRAMEINEAYEALEHMRQLNLGLVCQELGAFDIDHAECNACILKRARKANESGSPYRKAWLQRSKADRCLTCGSPSCASHSSDIFRKEGITLCKECEKIFHTDFILSCMTLEAKERRKRMDHLTDLYDRTVLLLRYSSQYIEEVAVALEQTKMRQSKINVGGSSAGIVSGVLGVAAAFTIFTPAGPPLLVASLLFGGGATAVQTGTEIKKQFFFEPEKVADRILALHGMLLTILTVTGTLRDAALLDQDLSRFVDEDSMAVKELKKMYMENREKVLTSAMEHEASASIRVDRAMLAAAVAAEMKHSRRRKRGKMNSRSKSGISIVTRNSRYMSRLSAGIMRTAQLAQFAGGALAAASLLIEARGMTNAIRSIRSGSCEKAGTLRRIAESMHDFPSTSNLDKECKAFLSFMNERSEMTEEEAAQLLMEVSTKDENQELDNVVDSDEGDDNEDEEWYEDENEKPIMEGGIQIVKKGTKSMHDRSTSMTASTTSSVDLSTLQEDAVNEKHAISLPVH